MSRDLFAGTFLDANLAPIPPDARVRRTHATGPGAPGYVLDGTVVGFGRTRVLVEWDDHDYGIIRGKPGKPHSVAPGNLVGLWLTIKAKPVYTQRVPG